MSADQSSYFDRPRFVVKKVLAKPQHEGQGAVVRRSIGRLYISILISSFFLDLFTMIIHTVEIMGQTGSDRI